LWIGPRRCLFINHPELIRQAAVVERRSLVRGYSALLLRTVLGNGLLVSEGAFWERQRRAIRPAVASPADSCGSRRRRSLARFASVSA